MYRALYIELYVQSSIYLELRCLRIALGHRHCNELGDRGGGVLIFVSVAPVPQQDRQTDRQTDRQRDRQTGRQTDRQTDSQTDRQRKTDRQTDRHSRIHTYVDTYIHTRTRACMHTYIH